ncbi:AraC family transcriptional regulator [Sphingobacterium sp. HJSM2_6]|uniref:AraC family transcriptional regulator n=1 Tax=Sphingobacterium sp. HJSM2_6 TaxID=3366264 RepID=UPI003BC61ACD
MIPKFHQVPKQSDNTFRIRHDILPNFGSIWHYHPEMELHYVIKGQGLKFIGDNISNFQEDEMVLLGSNIPHTWKCHIPKESDHYVEAMVLHFHPDSLGKEFLHLPETFELLKLLNSSKTGLYILGDTKQKVKEYMINMLESSKLRKVIYLLEIFDILSQTKHYSPITQDYANSKFNSIDEERMNSIFNYTFKHFREKIYVEEVANIVSLSVTSFCRYFKQMANKSYFDFLTEVRLNHACRLLINSNYAIKQIAEDAGFENTSNFYRHFKILKQCTPKEYIQQFS